MESDNQKQSLCVKNRSNGFSFRRLQFTCNIYAEKAIRTFFSLAVCQIPCVLCGEPAGAISLCPECRSLLNKEASIANEDAKRCCKCGRPLLSEHDICTTCRETPLFQNVDKVFPLFAYVLSKKKLLYSWKIGRQHNLTEVFAEYIVAGLKTHFPEAAVIPVPPRPGKLKKTGWDQIEDMARHLEFRHEVPVLRILRRTEAVQQKKLTKEERAEHSKKAYILDDKALRQYKEHYDSVVLLDDVITTGNTICACADILKGAGFQHVSAVSLFIVPG